jgi:hypothetical protein
MSPGPVMCSPRVGPSGHEGTATVTLPILLSAGTTPSAACTGVSAERGAALVRGAGSAGRSTGERRTRSPSLGGGLRQFRRRIRKHDQQRGRGRESDRGRDRLLGSTRWHPP